MAKLCVLLVLAALAVAAVRAQPAEPGCKTVAQTAAETPELATLVAALTAANVTETLDDPTLAVTVLAPTNAAFSALFDTLGVTPEQALSDIETTTKILLYHVVDTPALSTSLTDGQKLMTMEGTPITVKLQDGGVVLEPTGGPSAKVVTPDVRACNSIVHIIDGVLLPQM